MVLLLMNICSFALYKCVLVMLTNFRNFCRFLLKSALLEREIIFNRIASKDKHVKIILFISFTDVYTVND